MKHNYLKQLKSGILDQNPTLVQLLGMWCRFTSRWVCSFR